MDYFSRKPIFRKKQKNALEKRIDKLKQFASEFWPTGSDEDYNSRHKKNKTIFF